MQPPIYLKAGMEKITIKCTVAEAKAVKTILERGVLLGSPPSITKLVLGFNSRLHRAIADIEKEKV